MANNNHAYKNQVFRKYVEGIPATVIAEQLNIPIQTIYSWIKRDGWKEKRKQEERQIEDATVSAKKRGSFRRQDTLEQAKDSAAKCAKIIADVLTEQKILILKQGGYAEMPITLAETKKLAWLDKNMKNLAYHRPLEAVQKIIASQEHRDLARGDVGEVSSEVLAEAITKIVMEGEDI